MAHNLARWTARIGLGEQIVATKTLRRRFFSIAGRLTPLGAPPHTALASALALGGPVHWRPDPVAHPAASLLTVAPATGPPSSPLFTSQSKISPTRAARIGQRECLAAYGHCMSGSPSPTTGHYWPRPSHIRRVGLLSIPVMSCSSALPTPFGGFGFRPEHIKAIDWLNALAPDKVWFFAVEIHAIQIGDSLPAADFRLVAVPANWEGGHGRAVIPSRPDQSESEEFGEFFQPLVNELNRTGFTDLAEANTEYYQEFPSAADDELTYQVSFEDDSAWVYLRWWGSRTGREHSNRVYDALNSNKERIEADFGAELDWRRNGNTVGFYVSTSRYATINDPSPALDQSARGCWKLSPSFAKYSTHAWRKSSPSWNRSNPDVPTP